MPFLAHTGTVTIATRGRGFYPLTDALTGHLPLAALSAGTCTLCIMHTSASLIIFENADPSAKVDIEAWMLRMIPDGDAGHTHAHEGPDDMPSHIRAAITATTLTIPIRDGKLMLGQWQGVYLWEHRTAPHRRTVAITCMGEGEHDPGERGD